MSYDYSFTVWVDRNMRVYLLLDFPVMLAKMEVSILSLLHPQDVCVCVTYMYVYFLKMWSLWFL